MANQNVQEIKSDPKEKAIASLVLGIISGTPSIVTIAVLVPVELWDIMLPMIPIPPLPLIFFPTLPFVGIIGLTLGILGLKSTKRNFAIAGIVLNAIGLLVPLYYFIFS